jgi:hypothetical protein
MKLPLDLFVLLQIIGKLNRFQLIKLPNLKKTENQAKNNPVILMVSVKS